MTDSHHHRLHRARRVQPQHQFSLGDRSHQIAFVDSAGLVVDVEHAAADHHRHEYRQRDRARQQKLHVFDIGIELDNLQHALLQDPRLDHGIVQRVGDLGQLILERGAHEIVAVVHHQCDLRLIMLVHLAGILRRNNHRALDLSVAHIFHRLFRIAVVERLEGPHIGADGIERFADSSAPAFLRPGPPDPAGRRVSSRRTRCPAR